MTDWRADAACKGQGETMFSDGPGDAALAICGACPATWVCLWATMVEEAASQVEDRYGVAGGMTACQREALAAQLPVEVLQAAHTAALAVREVVGCEAPTLERRRRPARRRPTATQAHRPVADPASEEVIRLVAAAYGLEPGLLRGPSRARHVVDARHLAMYLLRESTGLSFPALGAVFGRDHTTVMHAVQRMQAEVEGRPRLRQVVDGLRARIRGEVPASEPVEPFVEAGPEAEAAGPAATADAGGVLVPEGRSRLVVETAARVCGVSVDELRSRSRMRHVCAARQVAMYALRELTGLSYPAIGRAVGGKDHTTAMHGVERVRSAVAQGGDGIGRRAAEVVAALRDDCEQLAA